MNVVVLGSINIDLVIRAPRLPLAGETIRGTEFFTAPGGKGANQAVAAARMGAHSKIIGRVGPDDFGRHALEALSGSGVDVSSVSVDDDGPTGVASIYVSDAGENTIVTSGGANHHIGDEELSKLRDTLPDAGVLLIQLEVPMDVVARAVTIAKQASVPVVLDPSPIGDVPEETLRDLDWITPNEVEAEALTGSFDARAAAMSLHARGARHVVVTLGPRGCLYAGAEGTFEVAAPAVEVIDTVACGDAFNGALAASLEAGVPDALEIACAAGALAATTAGAQPSLPTGAEVERLLRSS